jgi:hypothetical protein
MYEPLSVDEEGTGPAGCYIDKRSNACVMRANALHLCLHLIIHSFPIRAGSPFTTDVYYRADVERSVNVGSLTCRLSAYTLSRQSTSQT